MNFSNSKKSIKYDQVEGMDPVEKYEKLGKFPYKMVVHLLLVIFTTCQAILIVAEANKYSRSQERFLYNMFIDTSDKRAMDFNRITYLYSIDEIRNHLNQSITNFYGLKTKSLEIVKFNSPSPVVQMEFRYIDNNKIQRQIREDEISDDNYITFNQTDKSNESAFDTTNYGPIQLRKAIKKRFEYVVNNQTLGPFDYPDDDVKEFLNDVVEFRLNYTLRTYVPYFYNNNYDCNLWSINQVYSFASRGHFVVRLNIFRLACADLTANHSYTDLFINKLLWIHLIVLILAIISLILTWNYIQWIGSLYMKVKSKHKQKLRKGEEEAFCTRSEDSIYYNPLLDDNLRRQTEEETKRAKNMEISSMKSGFSPSKKRNGDNETDQYRFRTGAEKGEEKAKTPKFNSWSVICLVGNIIQIFASAISIFDTNNIMTSTEILVGFGCMLAIINIGRYIEFAENYSTIYVTIKNALPNVGRYLIGVTPIFLGFIFFGLCIFWRSERFTNTSSVMIILFALAQGDSVLDTFRDLSGFYFFLGQVYLYLFCIMFIVVVLNIFIAIIEEAYIISKMQNKTHWVFDYIKKDKKQTLQFKPPIEELHKPKTTSEKPTKSSIFGKDVQPSSIVNEKKRLEFASHPSNNFYKRSLPEGPSSFRSVDDENNQMDLQKKLDEEFALIEQDLNAILELSMDIKKSGDDQLIDEIRILVLERINSSILIKTQDVRSAITKENI